MFGFGAGRARIVPSGGTPYELGVVQSASVEFKVDLKELRGPYRYPQAVADGKGTCSGKVAFANLWPPTLSEILAGSAPTGQGGYYAAVNETHTIGPQSSTYGTTTLTNGSTFVSNSEVVIVTVAGVPYFYTRVLLNIATAQATAVNPLAGAYVITNAGVMTFALADVGNVTTVTYLYTPASNASSSFTMSQLGLNTAPTFQLTLIGIGKNVYSNAAQQYIIVLNSVLAPSLKLDFKLDDFTMIDLDFSAFVDQTGNLGTFYFVASDA
jgi:hypothetical protein